MNCNKLFCRIINSFSGRFQLLLINTFSDSNVSLSTCISKSKIIFKGNSKLNIEDGIVIHGACIVLENSEFSIASNVRLSNVNISAKDNSRLLISSSVSINRYDWRLEHAFLAIGENCIFNQGRNALRPYFNISQGQLHIASHNVIRADFWIRFGGIVEVGQYNCINERTELRSDESIRIGDYNMISYDCTIWDTNTHCMYTPEVRRHKTKLEFPMIGAESERPKTNPIVIGSDCWIGKGAVILKGSILEDSVVVGTKAIICNQIVKKARKIVPCKSIEV